MNCAILQRPDGLSERPIINLVGDSAEETLEMGWWLKVHWNALQSIEGEGKDKDS